MRETERALGLFQNASSATERRELRLANHVHA